MLSAIGIAAALFIGLPAQSTPVDLGNVPLQVLKALNSYGSRYQISRRMNPFYLRADFDGDGRADYVVLIAESATKKGGFAFCFGDARKKPQIAGAGVSIPLEGKLPGINLDSINVWGIATECGKSIRECLFVEQALAGSSWFIWNGKWFVWKQGGI